MRAELEKIGAPQDLVQILSEPVTKDLTQALMEAVDLVVVTGSQDNVRRAYASGTPAIGVGVGNVPVIIDETADLASAAAKVCASKSFDDATSCSSENAIVILDETYEAAMAALQADTGVAPRKSSALSNCFGAMASSNRDLIARDAAVR
jgi:sulfoacetaldehyde dehydrogenase